MIKKIDASTYNYLTRAHYPTIIGIYVKKVNGCKIYSFSKGKVRDVRVPEKPEDKKVEMVISAIKELMEFEEKTSLMVELYEQKVEFFSNESRYEMYNKIFKTLIKSFGVEDKKSLKYGIKDLIDNALKNSEIDVF